MKEKIRSFITEHFLGGKRTITDDESLFDAGLIDSVQFLELIAFIEKEFSVSVNVAEATVDHFDSVNQIELFIREKQSG
jgi:acyl carrier protein